MNAASGSAHLTICSAVQMSQYWRPSAWADYFHAYSGMDRMLMDASFQNIPDPIFVDPAKLALIGFQLYLAFGEVGGVKLGGVWKVVSVTAAVCYGAVTAFTAFHETFRRNLAVSNTDAPSSTQRLLRHLCQLEAAFVVIQESARQRTAQAGPLSSASFSSGTASGLVLVHVGHKYALIKSRLMARLDAACLTCMKKRRVPMPPQAAMDKFKTIIDAKESLIRTNPY